MNWRTDWPTEKDAVMPWDGLLVTYTNRTGTRMVARAERLAESAAGAEGPAGYGYYPIAWMPYPLHPDRDPAGWRSGAELPGHGGWYFAVVETLGIIRMKYDSRTGWHVLAWRDYPEPYAGPAVALRRPTRTEG